MFGLIPLESYEACLDGVGGCEFCEVMLFCGGVGGILFGMLVFCCVVFCGIFCEIFGVICVVLIGFEFAAAGCTSEEF